MDSFLTEIKNAHLFAEYPRIQVRSATLSNLSG